MLAQSQTLISLFLLGGPLMLGTGACSAPPGSDTAATAQLTIEVRRGPLGPVELVGHESTAPVEGAVITIRDQQDREVARARSDAEGRAHVTVAPGAYRVVLLTCPGARLPEALPVFVASDASTVVGLQCDTEIQ